MRPAALFRLTAIAIVVQIALGGLVTFGFINPLAHIVVGLIVIALAVATVIVAYRSKPPDRQLRQVGIGLVAFLVLQVALGFTTLAIGSGVLAWIHLMVAVIAYAMTLTGMFFAQRQENISKVEPSQGQKGA
jgi:heme A synthase